MARDTSGGSTGVIYYALHEMAHLTPESQSFHATQWALYQQANPSDPTGEFFYAHPLGIDAERSTNNIYAAFANQIGTPVWSNAPYGY
jgi:hypothetical protein